jgi:hypothetical protein
MILGENKKKDLLEIMEKDVGKKMSKVTTVQFSIQRQHLNSF